MTSVLVIRRDHTTASYARCTVDEFEAGTLTIMAEDGKTVMQTFQPGTWQRATQYDANGYADHSFTAR